MLVGRRSCIIFERRGGGARQPVCQVIGSRQGVPFDDDITGLLWYEICVPLMFSRSLPDISFTVASAFDTPLVTFIPSLPVDPQRPVSHLGINTRKH